MAMASVNLRIPPVNSPVNLSSTKSLTLGSNLSIPLSSTSSPSNSLSISPLFIYCGRGDKKTAKGKRFNHSWGNSRPRNKNKGRGPPRVYAPPAPPRKDKFGEDDFVEVDIDDSPSETGDSPFEEGDSPLK